MLKMGTVVPENAPFSPKEEFVFFSLIKVKFDWWIIYVATEHRLYLVY